MSTIKGWFPLTKRPVTLIVRSRLFRYCEHFYNDPLGSARCDGIGCVLCEVSRPREIACLAVSKFGSQNIYLLRLTDGVQAFADELEARGPQLIGTLIDACRDKKGDFWIQEFHVVGHEVATPIMIQNYVSAIGVKSYQLRAMAMHKPAHLALDIPVAQ